jgi:hypothetical protein
MIDNPLYKGKWHAPLINNPNYQGKWKPRKIPNPDYFYDSEPFRMTSIGGIGIELWSMSSEIYFDNMVRFKHATSNRHVRDIKTGPFSYCYFFDNFCLICILNQKQQGSKHQTPC